MAMPQVTKEEKKGAYSLLLPDGFDFSAVQKFEAQGSTEDVAKENSGASSPNGDQKPPDFGYDPMAPGYVPVTPNQLGDFKDLDLDPLLRRSIRGSHIPEREIFREEPDQNSILDAPTAEANRRLNRLKLPSPSSATPERLAGIIEELGKMKLEVGEEMERQQVLADGAMRNASGFKKEKDMSFYALNSVSEVSALAYTPFHSLSKTFDWDIFSSPPSSLLSQQNQRIKEVEMEAKYRKGIVSGMDSALKEFDGAFDKLKGLQAELSRETDPGRSLELTERAQVQVREVVDILSKGVNSKDPTLRAEWDEMRTKVSEGLAGLDKQLMYTEVGLRATEKTVIVAGAIIATVPTAGTSLGVLGGLGAGAAIGAVGGGSQMLGHGIGHGLMGTGEKFDIGAETLDVISDIKDGSLYAVGGVLSNFALARGGQAVASTIEPFARAGLGGLAKIFVQSPLRALGTPLMRAGQAGWSSSRFVAGGATRGLISEAPAAFVDTTIAPTAIGGQLLDPTGELTQMNIPQFDQWMRALSLRIGVATAGGALGHGFQGFRGGIGALGRNSTGYTGAIMNSTPMRGSLRTAGELLTVPELGLDVWNGAYTEAILGSWFFGDQARASEKDMEQIFVSSIAGHFAGRTFQPVDAAMRQRRQVAAVAAATQLNTAVVGQADKFGVAPDRVVTVVARQDKNSLSISQDPSLANPIGLHLGNREGIATHVASRLEHRATGIAARNVDRKLGGVMEDLNKTAAAQIEGIISSSRNGVGQSTSLTRDRKDALKGLLDGLSRRSTQFGQLGDIDSPRRVQDLHEHVRTYLAEFSGTRRIEPRTLLGTVRQLVNPQNLRALFTIDGFNAYWRSADRLYNSYLNSKRGEVKFVDGDKPNLPDSELKPGILRATLDRTPFVKRLGPNMDWAAAKVEDGVAWTSRNFGRPLVAFADNTGVSWALRSTTQLASGLGISLYSTPTASIYGGIGTIITAGYAGAGFTLNTAKSISGAIGYLPYWGYQKWGTGTIYGRGNGIEAGELLAKKVEGEQLLARVRQLNRENPGTVRQRTERLLVQEITETNRRFTRANARHSGAFGLLARGYERATNGFTADQVQNPGRMISDASIAGIERVSRRLFASAQAEGRLMPTKILREHVEGEINSNNPRVENVERIVRVLLREGSSLHVDRQVEMRDRLHELVNVRLQEIDQKISAAKSKREEPKKNDIELSEKLGRIREVIKVSEDHIFALEHRLDPRRKAELERTETKKNRIRNTEDLVNKVLAEIRQNLNEKKPNVDEARTALTLLFTHEGLKGHKALRGAKQELRDLIEARKQAKALSKEDADSLDVFDGEKHESTQRQKQIARELGEVYRKTLGEAISDPLVERAEKGAFRDLNSRRTNLQFADRVMAELQAAYAEQGHLLGYLSTQDVVLPLLNIYRREARVYAIAQGTLVDTPEFQNLSNQSIAGIDRAQKTLSRILDQGLTHDQKAGRSKDKILELWNTNEDFRNSVSNRLNSFYSRGSTFEEASLQGVRSVVTFERQAESQVWRNAEIEEGSYFQPLLARLERLSNLRKITETAIATAADADQISRIVRGEEALLGNFRSRAILWSMKNDIRNAIKEGLVKFGLQGDELAALEVRINQALLELSR